MAINPVTATGVNAPGKRGRKRAKQRGPTGLYHGKAGEFAAQKNPEGYINTITGKAGAGGVGGTGYTNWYNELGMDQIYNQGYQRALAGNERLSLRDYMEQAGGGNLQDQLNQEYQHWLSSNDPQGYWNQFRTAQGQNVGSGSMYDQYMSSSGFNKRLGQYQNAAATRPELSFDEFLQGSYDPTAEVIAGTGSYQANDDKGKGRRKKGRR